MIRNIILLLTITLCAYAYAATPSVAARSADTVGVVDNSVDSKTIDTAAVDDTTANVAAADSSVKKRMDVVHLDDDELLQAALSVDSVNNAPIMQKLDLIRREHEYKKQTRAALIMMIFIAAAMATSQSWNPR